MLVFLEVLTAFGLKAVMEIRHLIIDLLLLQKLELHWNIIQVKEN